MNTSDIQLLFDYNYWANGRILTAAERITVEQLHQLAGLSHGSIQGALAHVLGAEIIWRLRLQEGVSLTALPLASEFPALADLKSRWASEEASMRAYLGGLSDQDLTRLFRYKNTQGFEFELPVWPVLVHIVNHGTQFRGEAAVALSQLKCSPGDIDLYRFYLDNIHPAGKTSEK
jgi:uncharacterized damage-inducible protein DinB